MNRTTKIKSKTPPAATIDAWLRPADGPVEIASANGGELKRLPTAADMDGANLAEVLAEIAITSIEADLRLEEQLMLRREMYAAGRRTAEAVLEAKPVPGTEAAALRAEALARVTSAHELHREELRPVLRQTRDGETLVRHHFSFLREARFAPGDVARRARVHLLVSSGSLASHPGFGTDFLDPLAGKLVLHEGVYGMTVTSVPITTNDQLVAHGGPHVDHGGTLLAPLLERSVEALDGIQMDRDGEEGVVLVCAPLRSRRASEYEDEDVIIGGQFALAGKFFHDLTRAGGGFGGTVTGVRSADTLSDAYLAPDPLIRDYRNRADKIEGGLIVAAHATDPVTQDRSLVNFHGLHVARARRGEPTYQIAVRFALNYLRRILKVAGHRLLVPASQRAKVIDDLQTELRKELVSTPQAMFESLKLVVDTESEDGKAALAKGGVRLNAVVTMNSRTEFVLLTILPQ